MRSALAMIPASFPSLPSLPSLLSLLTLLGAVAGGGCSDVNSSAKLDGGPIGGGGMTGTLNCGDSNQAIDPTALIDDMESPAFATVMAAGRNGAWWAGGDMMSAGSKIQPDGNADAESIPGGRCGSKYAEHVTGQGFSMWAILSVSMGWDDAAKVILPNDNSFRTGVSFWARIGDTSINQVRFQISDKYSRPEGGICVMDGPPDVDCYDTFGVDLTELDTTWKQYRIPFGGLTQQHFGLPRPHLDASSIYTIEFNFGQSGSAFDFWVDDIAFY